MFIQISQKAGVRFASITLLTTLPMVTGCSAILANAFRTQRVEQRTFDVQGQPAVIVETFNGNIKVNAVAGNVVDAKITKSGSGATQKAAEDDLQNISLDLSQDGNTVRIVARRVGPRMFGSSGAAMELNVPTGSALTLNTSNGEIVARGLNREIIAKSSNGQIDVEGAQGKLDLETSNGEIEVDATEAVLKARTSNGNVGFMGTLARGEHLLHTSNGSVRLGLPASTPFEFAAETSNGTIQSRVPGLQTRSGKPGSRHWSAMTGSAEVPIKVDLETSNGSITIDPLKQAEAPVLR